LPSVEPESHLGPVFDHSFTRVVAAPAATGQPVRCAVVLNDVGPVERSRPAMVTTSEAGPPPCGWLPLVERVLGDWAPTLRLAILLLIILMALIAAIAVLLGLGSALAVLGGAVVMQTLASRPVKAIRA
jgi:hypothetical protein